MLPEKTMPYFAEPLVLRLGYSLLHFLWQGALIAVLAAVTLRFLRSADASRRYALLLCGITLMAFVPLITFCIIDLPDGIAGHEPTPIVIDNDPPSIPAAQHPDGPAPTDPVAVTTTPPMTVPVARPRPSLGMLVQEWTRRWMIPLVLAWAVGVCLLSLRFLFSWAGVLRVRRRGLSPACDRIQHLSRPLCAALLVRQTVRVCESALVQVPAVVGWLRPMILLPARLVTRLSDDELRAILAHELAHIRRHDYLVNVVQIVIETVLFYHPAVWWLSRRLRQEREHCCDDLASAACGGNRILARALASLAELHAAAPYALPAATGGSLVQRIRRLVQPESESERLVPGGLGLGLGLGLLCTVGAILAVSPLIVSVPASEDQAEQDAGSEQLESSSAEKNPAVPKDPVPFEILYAIPDGSVLHRVSSPPPAEALKRYESAAGPAQVAAMPEVPSGNIWKSDGENIELKSSSFGGPEGHSLFNLIEFLVGVKMSELHGDAELWTKRVPGDFVVRTGATPEQLVADLERILNAEMNLNATLGFEEVERDVYVATGKFVARPAGPAAQFPGKPLQYQLYGHKQAEFPMDGWGTFDDFLKTVSIRVGCWVVNEAEDTPAGKIVWALSYDNLDQTTWETIPPKTFSANAGLVLKHLNDQTGLRFTRAKRKVRVLTLKARAAAEADDGKPNAEIDAAIQRLRQRDIFVREFHPRTDPQYWVQITTENKGEAAVLADVAIVARGVKLHCHLRNISFAPHDFPGGRRRHG